MPVHSKASRIYAQTYARDHDANVGGKLSAPASGDAARIAKLCEANKHSLDDLLSAMHPDNPTDLSEYLCGITKDHFSRHYPHPVTHQQLATHISAEAVVGFRLGHTADFTRLQKRLNAGERPLASYFRQGEQMTSGEATAASIVNFAAPLGEEVVGGGSMLASPARFLGVQYLAIKSCEDLETTPVERMKFILTLSINLIAYNDEAIKKIAALLISESSAALPTRIHEVLRDNTYLIRNALPLFIKTKHIAKRMMEEVNFHLETDAFGAMH